MKWQLIFVGRPALDYAKRGVAEYEKRLKRYAKVELISLKDGPRADVEGRMWKASEGSLRILMDERGELWDTQALKTRVDDWENQSVKSVSLLIGGANGHSEELREKVDFILCLGRFTLQHELALVVLLEQIYRVYTMKRGEPYHR